MLALKPWSYKRFAYIEKSLWLEIANSRRNQTRNFSGLATVWYIYAEIKKIFYFPYA